MVYMKLRSAQQRKRISHTFALLAGWRAAYQFEGMRMNISKTRGVRLAIATEIRESRHKIKSSKHSSKKRMTITALIPV